jgi:hypothetical protein
MRTSTAPQLPSLAASDWSTRASGPTSSRSQDDTSCNTESVAHALQRDAVFATLFGDREASSAQKSAAQHAALEQAPHLCGASPQHSAAQQAFEPKAQARSCGASGLQHCRSARAAALQAQSAAPLAAGLPAALRADDLPGPTCLGGACAPGGSPGGATPSGATRCQTMCAAPPPSAQTDR